MQNMRYCDFFCASITLDIEPYSRSFFSTLAVFSSWFLLFDYFPLLGFLPQGLISYMTSLHSAQRMLSETRIETAPVTFHFDLSAYARHPCL